LLERTTKFLDILVFIAIMHLFVIAKDMNVNKSVKL
jgi:hypothetical protein